VTTARVRRRLRPCVMHIGSVDSGRSLALVASVVYFPRRKAVYGPNQADFSSLFCFLPVLSSQREFASRSQP
jgi:hypothetical protein